MLFIGSPQDLTLVRTGRGQQPFIIHTGDNVLQLSVAIFAVDTGIKWLDAAGENYRPDIDVNLLSRLVKIYGISLTDAPADITFSLFQVKATFFINIGDQGNCLGKVDMDGFVF